VKFIVGLLAGVVLGMVGAVVYAGRSGQDLRETYAKVRSDLEKRDLDELGARLEARFAEVQATVEARIGEAREKAAAAAEEAATAVDEATDSAGDAAQKVAADLADVAEEAREG
jgi:gas vesicle protein